MPETVAAVYKTQAQAESAVQDLLVAGIPESSIDRHMQGGSYLGGSITITSRESLSVMIPSMSTTTWVAPAVSRRRPLPMPQRR
jgi:hypothetical protein